MKTFLISRTESLLPDPNPPFPNDKNVATLRIQQQPDSRYYMVEQDYLEDSVLGGMATMGGLWTIFDGFFAMLFGGGLLLAAVGMTLARATHTEICPN